MHCLVAVFVNVPVGQAPTQLPVLILPLIVVRSR